MPTMPRKVVWLPMTTWTLRPSSVSSVAPQLWTALSLDETSAQKAIDVSVLDFYNQVEGGYLGGTDYSGTIANKGVLLSPFHDFDAQIPADLKAEIATLQTALGNGSVTLGSFLKRGC